MVGAYLDRWMYRFWRDMGPIHTILKIHRPQMKFWKSVFTRWKSVFYFWIFFGISEIMEYFWWYANGAQCPSNAANLLLYLWYGGVVFTTSSAYGKNAWSLCVFVIFVDIVSLFLIGASKWLYSLLSSTNQYLENCKSVDPGFNHLSR